MWSSVLPEYRRQGVLTEMIGHRIDLARKLGFDTSVVQCMPMSGPVYDKFGYQNKEKLNIYAINMGSIGIQHA
jgi:predicted acetyltransferase